MKLTFNQLLFILILFIIYSGCITAYLGYKLRHTEKKQDLIGYELGKKIGSRAIKDYLIQSHQVKTPILINFKAILKIEDSLELNYKP